MKTPSQCLCIIASVLPCFLPTPSLLHRQRNGLFINLYICISGPPLLLLWVHTWISNDWLDLCSRDPLTSQNRCLGFSQTCFFLSLEMGPPSLNPLMSKTNELVLSPSLPLPSTTSSVFFLAVKYMPGWSVAHCWIPGPARLPLIPCTGMAFQLGSPSRFSIHSSHSDVSECGSALCKHSVASHALGSTPNSMPWPPGFHPTWPLYLLSARHFDLAPPHFYFRPLHLLFAYAVPWAPPAPDRHVFDCIFSFSFSLKCHLFRSVLSPPHQECLPW